MATRSKPFEQFGPYVLFKKLEENHLGDLWRAGKVEQGSIRTVALHRLTGGGAEALRQSALVAKATAEQITGTSIAKNQIIDVIAGLPIIEHDYKGGRSLRHIVAKAAHPTTPHPIPVDQALSIAEKIATAVDLVHNFRIDGARVVHGAVIPQFIWIEEDGEIRCAGQRLGKGLLAALSYPTIAKEIGPFFAPEVRKFGEPGASGDVYAVGAILYLLLTGKGPPDPSNPAEVTQAVYRATLMSGEPIPKDVGSILQKSLAPDINGRYGDAADLRRELGKLLHGGAYAPTTFNLAFFLHNLLKKEFEGEALEREKETKVNPALYMETTTGAQPKVGGPVLMTPRKRSRAPLLGVGAALLAVAGFGAFWVVTHQQPQREPQQVASQAPPAQPTPLTDVVTAMVPDTMPAVQLDTAAAEEQRKKRIQEEVERRVQAEMMKLQADYDQQLAREQAAARAAPERQSERQPMLTRLEPPPRREPEPVPLPPPAPAIAQTSTRLEEPQTQLPPPTSPISEPTATTPSLQQVVAEPSPPPQPVEVRDGDLVGINQVDQAPRPQSPIRPAYPPIALRQRLDATVFVSALVSESGEVLDVKVLRGDPRKVGFDEAAVRAVRRATFFPAIKDGKRVRTWFPIPIRFQS